MKTVTRAGRMPAECILANSSLRSQVVLVPPVESASFPHIPDFTTAGAEGSELKLGSIWEAAGVFSSPSFPASGEKRC